MVCTVTGNGLKDPDTALRDMPTVSPVPVDPVAVVAKLGLVVVAMLPAGLLGSSVVAASSANLGPGFDSLGLALSLYDEIIVETTDSGLVVEVEGEGAGRTGARRRPFGGPRHRAWAAGRWGQRAGLKVQCRNAIPHSRGVGSSAAAVVGGLAVVNGLACASGFDATEPSRVDSAGIGVRGPSRQRRGSGAGRRSGVLDRPERLAACVFSGSVRLHPDIRLFPAIPQQRSSTAEARVLLPTQVSHEDARFNVSRAALLVVALTERPDLLMAATEDVLHQPQRASAMPSSAEYLELLRRCNVAAVLSGAGPAVIALSTASELPAEALEYAAANGFAVSEMTAGDGVRWSPGVTVPS